MRRSYAAFLDSGPRSTEKLAPLHGWVQEELRRHLRDSAKYTLTGQTAETRNERKIEGRYYEKRVDVSVEAGDRILAVVNVKFILGTPSTTSNNRSGKRRICGGRTSSMETCSS